MNQYTDRRGRPRIVVTGMGAVTPVGNTVGESWQSALIGRSGIGPVTQFDASALPCRIAGEVKNFDPREFVEYKEARRMSRASQLAAAAGHLDVKLISTQVRNPGVGPNCDFERIERCHRQA